MLRIDIILETREASFVIFDVAFADRILRIRLVTSVAILSPIAEDDWVHESKILGVSFREFEEGNRRSLESHML